jgi:hypothetical protein
MTKFTDLPAELTLEILSYFEYDRTTLRQLCLVSTYFGTLAKQVLLKHVDLRLDVSGAGEKSLFDSLTRMLDRDPSLCWFIRTLVLSWTAPFPRNNIWASELLRRLSNLEFLGISTPMYRSQELNLNFCPKFLQTHPPNSPMTLKRRGGSFSWAALEELLHLLVLQGAIPGASSSRWSTFSLWGDVRWWVLIAEETRVR